MGTAVWSVSLLASRIMITDPFAIHPHIIAMSRLEALIRTISQLFEPGLAGICG